MNNFSSRELAVTFWAVAFLTLALSNKGVRESVLNLVRKALLSKLIIVWLSLAAYSVILVFGLRKLGFWKFDLLKDTLIWFAFGALTYPFQFHDPQKTPRVLKVLVRDSLSVLIVVEVLVETYTFSLPIELIIVPTVTLIVMMGAVSEMQEEEKPIAKMLGNIQALVGFVLIAIVIQRAATDPEHSFIAALLSSLIVVVLSLATWPYICFLRLVFVYEGMLWRIGWKKNVPRAFKHFAAFRILRYLKYRSTAVAPFIRRNAFKLFDIVDQESLEAILDEDRRANNSL